MNRYGLVIIAVAIALLVVVVWKPAQQYAGFQSPISSPSASPSPSPSPTQPEPTPEPTSEPELTSTPEAPRARFDKCVDGSAFTVTGRDANQTNYRCASGAEGAYLNK